MRFVPGIIAFLVTLPASAAPVANAFPAKVSVCFTPAQQCEPLIVDAIDSAKE